MSNYTHENMLTCATVWEALLDAREANSKLGQVLTKAFEQVGTSSMRDFAVAWAPLMDELWDKTEWLHGGCEPFDWEFVPRVLHYTALLNGDIGILTSTDKHNAHLAAVLASLALLNVQFETFQNFDTRFVTLFRDSDGEDYWDDADPTNDNAIRSAMGVYGRDSDGMAHHLIDIPFDGHMVERLKLVMDALKTWLVDNAEEIAA